MTLIRILIVDDQSSVRQALRWVLESEVDMVVVGEACDGTTALVQAQALQADVVLMDVELPGEDGIATAQRLHTLAPNIGIIVLTLHDDVATRNRAIAAGAIALLNKQDAIDDLPNKVRALYKQLYEGSG